MLYERHELLTVPSTSNYAVVLFDLDGTLIDSAQCGILATRRAFDTFGLDQPHDQQIVDLMGIPIEDSFPAMAPSLADKRRCDQVIEQFRRHYAELSQHHISLFPGVLELLDDLKRAETKMGIVTSKHGPVATRNLRTLDIEHYFEVVIGPERVVQPKPAPDTALHALEMLEFYSQENVIVVGDASFDIQMGLRAGLRTCAVGWGAHSLERLALDKPHYQASSVAELRSHLLPTVSNSSATIMAV